LRTTIFDTVRKIDWPTPFTGRALANDFTRRWHGKEAALAAGLEAENDRYMAAAGRGDVATAVVWAGEGIDLIHAIEPAEKNPDAHRRRGRGRHRPRRPAGDGRLGIEVVRCVLPGMSATVQPEKS
jgi:Dioxygenases related to 2-nitropropane dioxygenase